jgi:hypothetical protein
VILVVKFFAYLALGFGTLHYLQRLARQRGVLGQY